MKVRVGSGACIALPFPQFSLRRVVNATPRPLYLRVRATVPILQEAVLASCLSGWVRKLLPPPGFKPRTVHLLANRTVTCAIPFWNEGTDKKSLKPVSPYEAPSQFWCVRKACVNGDRFCRLLIYEEWQQWRKILQDIFASTVTKHSVSRVELSLWKCLKYVNFAT